MLYPVAGPGAFVSTETVVDSALVGSALVVVVVVVVCVVVVGGLVGQGDSEAQVLLDVI